jgi:hypothetical protein
VANEFERLDALERVRSIFLAIERPYIRRIDASGTPEAVLAACMSAVDALR